MCESCSNIQVNKVNLSVYIQSYDPTRTTGLRNAFVKDMNKRFNIITSLIKKAIIEEDVFGLNDKILANANTPGNKAYSFGSSSQKVDAFMKWLNSQVDRNLLETTSFNQVGNAINPAWSNLYIADSYKRGVQRARYELKKAGFSVPNIEQTGGIDVSMSTPFHTDRLGVMYSRTYNELKGITNAMDTQISRVLTQGIADGDNPRVLAKKLVNTIDGGGKDTLGRPTMSPRRRAEILARTEVINAHHKATVQEYRNWGAEGVKVQAEFTTAGDDRVCPICAGLNGKIYTLDQIENLIPVHPQCRCIALPTLPDDEEETVQESALSTFENSIKSNKNETVGIFFKDDLVFQKKGKENQVSFNISDLIQLTGKDKKKITLTHNHPSVSNGNGGSFSFADINTQLTFGWGKIRAVDANYIHELIYSGEVLKPKDIAKLKASYTRLLNNNFKNVANTARDKAEYTSKIYSETFHETVQQFTTKYSDLGFQYSRIKQK